MAIIIVQSDFALIGQLAIHCDKAKLNIAIQEAITFDLEPLLCDLFYDVDEHWASVVEKWTDLINGSTYTACGDKERKQPGIKKVLLYYAYARYTVMNNFNDTPNGHVTKTNEFSIPKPLREIESFADKYRTMGYITWEKVKNYLCVEKDLYESFNEKDCKGCGCGGDCDNKTKAKGYGIKGSNVSKWDVRNY